VPGNHERSQIPLQLWRNHPNLHIFDQPDTKIITIMGTRLAISGFPFTRKIGVVFPDVLRATRYEQFHADIRIICMHQAVEGAKVGPVNYTFRPGQDVIRGSDLPNSFCAVFSGHIHRSQTLRHDLQGMKLAVPVVYPGSVERTAFAEQKENKGYLVVNISTGEKPGGVLNNVVFHPLPARPMETLDFSLDHQPDAEILGQLKYRLAKIAPDAVVRIRLNGEINEATWQIFSARNLRSIAPETMNIELSFKANAERKEPSR
jgi:DNA repair exonuclease SbcCD nuclease subunit